MSATPLPPGLRERGKHRRRERIIRAAAELLRETPGQALTAERIAQRAEVSPPTVANLVGGRDQIWAAIAEQGLGDLDLEGLRTVKDPHERARRLAVAVVEMVINDEAVFREVVANWKQSALLVDHDPTGEFERCLVDGEALGLVPEGQNLRLFAEMIAAGLIGIIHQWSAGLLGPRALRARSRDVVDVVLAAAGTGEALSRATQRRPGRRT